jgi:hypothetical protein
MPKNFCFLYFSFHFLVYLEMPFLNEQVENIKFLISPSVLTRGTMASSKLASSPHGTCLGSGSFVGSSSPVGSMPKSFPHFQHPSHELLEDNGFKQQK